MFSHLFSLWLRLTTKHPKPAQCHLECAECRFHIVILYGTVSTLSMFRVSTQWYDVIGSSSQLYGSHENEQTFVFVWSFIPVNVIVIILTSTANKPLTVLETVECAPQVPNSVQYLDVYVYYWVFTVMKQPARCRTWQDLQMKIVAYR